MKEVSFEEAIALTQSLLTDMEAQKLTESEIETAIASLVQTLNGARGFFVTYLTMASPVTNQPSASVVKALKTSPEIVSDLLVKNLAMSTAMAITHRRNQDETMALVSDQVRERTSHLINLLQLEPIVTKLQLLEATINDSSGPYQQFLERWHYDQEQLTAIQTVIAPHLK